MTVDIATLGLQVRSDGVVTANQRLRQLQTQGRGAEQQTNRLSQGFRGASQSARMLRGALGALGVGLSLRGIQGLITSTAEWSANLVDTAENLDLTTTELQRFRAAARDSTVETDTLDQGLNRLNRRMGEARSGSGQLADVYEELGLQGMSTQEAFEEIADAVANADDSQEAARIGYAAFGRQVEDLLPLLRQGRNGLNQMGDEAERTGRVVDEALVRRGAEAATQLNRINDIMQANLRGGLLSGFASGMGDIESILTSSQFQDGLEQFGEVMGSTVRLIAENADTVMRVMGAFTGLAVMSRVGAVGGATGRRVGGAAGFMVGLFGPELGGAMAAAMTNEEAEEFKREFERAQSLPSERFESARHEQGLAHVDLGDESGLPDIGQIMNEAQAETERYNEALFRSEQIGRQSGFAISNAMENAAFGADSATEALARMSEELARIIMRAQLLEPLGDAIGGGIGGLFSPSSSSGGMDLSTATGTDISGLDFLNTPSFAGGGDTGNGPRSGGLDGQGGFMAMLHPRESVIDHTRGGSPTVNMPVRIENYGNDEVTANRETNERGLEELVITVAARDIQSGGKLGRAVNRVTGTTRRGAQR